VGLVYVKTAPAYRFDKGNGPRIKRGVTGSVWRESRTNKR